MVRSKITGLMDAHEPKMTLRGMENVTGLAQTTIIRARTDEGITGCSLGTLERIARALGCSIHDLFDDDPGQGGKGDPASSATSGK